MLVYGFGKASEVTTSSKQKSTIFLTQLINNEGYASAIYKPPPPGGVAALTHRPNPLMNAAPRAAPAAAMMPRSQAAGRAGTVPQATPSMHARSPATKALTR